jgi:hypothetical protein
MVNESTKEALIGAFGAGVPLLTLLSLMFCCLVRVTRKEEAERKERFDLEWAKIRGTAPSSAGCASSVPVPPSASTK